MVLEKTTIPFYPHHINMQIHLYDLPKSEGRLCKICLGCILSLAQAHIGIAQVEVDIGKLLA